MRYWISGASGFVGQNLIRYIQDTPWKGEICIINRTESTANKAKLPDVIIHLAGELDDPSKMYESNVELTRQWLQATKYMPYKVFIYVGSSAEYGFKDHPINEEDSLNPRNIYEATKAAGSVLCQGFAREYGKQIVIVRPFSLYGPNDKERKLIPIIKRKYLAGEIIEVAPGVHDWLYIDDFCEGIMRLVADGIDKMPQSQPGEVYNFGTGEQYQNSEVVKIALKVLKEKYGKEGHVMPAEKMYEYDSDRWLCDPTKAYMKLGWQSTTSLETGLRKTYDCE